MPQDRYSEAEVAAMPTDEFRAWAKTLNAKERSYWREFRRRLSQGRYEQKRVAALAAPLSKDSIMEATDVLARTIPLSDDELGAVRALLANEQPPRWDSLERAITEVKLRKEGTMELTTEELALLPPEVVAEIRRQRKLATAKRWREENAERHRAASKDSYERMKADPERWAEYKARKREQMQERRRSEHGDG